MKILVLLIVLLAMTTLPLVSSSYYTSSGISFAEIGDLYVTGHRLLIHASMDMSPYLDNMDQIFKRVNATMLKISQMMPIDRSHDRARWLKERSVLLDVLEGIRIAATSHFQDFSDYLKTIELTRNKRGLIDIGGTLFKSLFGLATEHDVSEVQRVLEYVATTQNDTIKQLNLHTIILNTTIDDVVNITAHIGRIYEHFDVIDDSLVEAFKLISENRFVTLIHLMATQTGNALQKLEVNMMKLKSAIFSAYDGRLDPYLIPPALALTILKGAAQNPQVRLPFIVSDKSLPLYYSIASIIPFRKSMKEFTFSIIIPVLSGLDAFTLYSINTLPVPSKDLYSIKIDMEAKYLAVSPNRQRYMPISNIDSCVVTHNTYLCPPDEPVFDFTAGICSIAAFQKKPHLDICDTHIYHGDLTYLRRLGNKWLFSFSKVLNATLLCSGKAASHLQLHGFGHLTLPSGCSLTVGNIYVPSLETIHLGNVSITVKEPLPLSPLFDDEEIVLMTALNLSHSTVRGQSLAGFKKDLKLIKLRRAQVLLHANIGHSTGTVALIISFILLTFFVVACFQERCRNRLVVQNPGIAFTPLVRQTPEIPVRQVESTIPATPHPSRATRCRQSPLLA